MCLGWAGRRHGIKVEECSSWHFCLVNRETSRCECFAWMLCAAVLHAGHLWSFQTSCRSGPQLPNENRTRYTMNIMKQQKGSQAACPVTHFSNLESISNAAEVKNYRKTSFLLLLNWEIHYDKAKSIVPQARVSLLPSREIRAGFLFFFQTPVHGFSAVLFWNECDFGILIFSSFLLLWESLAKWEMLFSTSLSFTFLCSLCLCFSKASFSLPLWLVLCLQVIVLSFFCSYT